VQVQRAWAAAAVLAAALTGGAALAQGKNLTLLGIPSATVAPAGVGYVALSGTDDSPMNARTDGSLELGYGLGSAERAVGLQGKLVITSLTDDFGDSGYLGFKLSRRVAAGAAPVYVGLDVDGLAGWGDSSEVDPSVSAMVTGFRALRSGDGVFPVMYTLGVGNRLRKDGTEPGVFAGVGAGFTDYLGGSVAWTGETLDLGLSLRPAAEVPLVVNVTLNDATDRLDERRLSISAAWVFRKGSGP
jgi:hypothetical protein